MAKRKARTAKPSANAPKGPAAPARRTGQGAGSAYAEMLRRQAQTPRVAPAAERESEPRPQAPTRSR